MQNMNRLWIGLGVVVLALGAYLYWGSGVFTGKGEIPSEVVQQFSITLRTNVARSLGTAEAHEPAMFMQVYPGLIPADFHNVKASDGIYRLENGELIYDPQGKINLSVASRAVSDTGMEQLLYNIAKRLKLDLSGKHTIYDVLDKIESAPSS